MLRNLRNAISSGGGEVSATGWPPYRRIVCGGSINVSAGQRVVQHCHCSALSVHPSDRLPFPLEFSNHNAVLENHDRLPATRPRKSLLISLAV